MSRPQLVSFTKAMTNSCTTSTSSWAKGLQVSVATTSGQLSNKAIATFTGTGGTYGGHTAILLSPEFSGGKLVAAWVVDQNFSFDGRIRKRKMYVSGTGVNNHTNYYIVQK